MTPEQSQRVTDIRLKMYSNVQQGKPSYEGLTEADIRLGLEAIRGGYSAEPKAKTTRAKKDKVVSEEAAAPPTPTRGAMLDKLAKFDLD